MTEYPRNCDHKQVTVRSFFGIPILMQRTARADESPGTWKWGWWRPASIFTQIGVNTLLNERNML